MLKSWAVAAALTIAALVPSPAAETPAPTGSVAVTIAGKIARHNRGAFDSFADAFLKYHEKSFDRALALDRDTLSGLPQVEITADARSWPRPLRLSGPRLADVLALAGAQPGTVTLYALDGYGVALTPEDLAARDWVLAIAADGTPLGLGGRGPAWLAYEKPAGAKASAEEEGKWVWSVFYVTVE